jgi:hypothetical protein
MKSRAGRKPLSSSGETKQIHVSLGDDLNTKLKQYCTSYGFAISEFVRMAVEKELNLRLEIRN